MVHRARFADVTPAAADDHCQLALVVDLLGDRLTRQAHGVVRPLFLQYDRTNGVARAYSDQESIAGTYSSGVDNSTRGFGTSKIVMCLVL